MSSFWNVDRKQIFDPALKQFANAFHLADPMFSDREAEAGWREARMEVISHLLQIVRDSPWKDHLVLRGSLLLKAWLGEAAREPGDIDWVVRPATLKILDRQSAELFEGLARLVSEQPNAGNAVIDVAHVAVDDIWTYDRAPGKRIVFPWQLEGLPVGSVQMDLVFGEKLWLPPMETALSFPGEKTISVWGAGKEISLAWKLLWLETDMYPQGKDLYDATLLAERTRLSLSLLNRVIQSGGLYPSTELTPDFPMRWDVDWENFQQEYPWVEGNAQDWQARLTAALAPTFAFKKIKLLGS